MTEFEAQLLRLKETLGLAEDQQVAEALGMTKAAFSYRKKAGSFPEGKVVALKAAHPDLDVMYVLSGRRASGKTRERIDSALKASAPHGGDYVVESLVRGIKEQGKLDERRAGKTASLVDLLPWLDDESLDLVIRLTAKLGGAHPRKS